MSARVAVYPGTFDPVTNGHVDVIMRAAGIFERIVVAVAVNAGKDPLFSVSERAELVRREVEELSGAKAEHIEVRIFDKLLMDFASSIGAACIIRGLRAVTDFEYEFQMAGMNARLNPNIETVFFMASERHQFISSRLVKEIARLGGDISSFVSMRIAHAVARQILESGGGS